MNAKFILVLLIVFASCQKEDLNAEFRNEIIEYQKKIPIPYSAEKYIYVANFSRIGNDTVFNLIRTPGLSKYDNVWGIYQDELLQPLAIIDSQNLGKNLLYNSRKNRKIQDYISIRLKEDFPPLYRYKIKKQKVILIKIDTISDNWRN